MTAVLQLLTTIAPHVLYGASAIALLYILLACNLNLDADSCLVGGESPATDAGDRTARGVSTPRAARCGLHIIDGSGFRARSRSIRRRNYARPLGAAAGDVAGHPATPPDDLTPHREPFQERAAPRATWRRQRRRDPP